MKEMGRRYLTLFSQAKAQHVRARDLPALDTLGQQEQRLPQIDLNHLRHMSDDTAMLQHAKFTVPDRAHGYCVDDNARALIVTVRAHNLNRSDTSLIDLSSIYLSFLNSAFDAGMPEFRGLGMRWHGSPKSYPMPAAHRGKVWLRAQLDPSSAPILPSRPVPKARVHESLRIQWRPAICARMT